MKEYLRVGQTLFHKYLGFVTVTLITDNDLSVDTDSRGNLPFAFNNFGRVLFFEEEHSGKSFNTYNDYLVFCQEDLRKKAFQKAKAAEENERLMIQKLREDERDKEEALERKRIVEENIKKYQDQKREPSRNVAGLVEANNRKLIELQGKKFTTIINDNQCGNILPSHEMLLKIKKEHEDKIKDAAKKRGIDHLVHFTRLENLQGILKHGLVPVSIQQELQIPSIRNDAMRIDSHLDCTSCSIQFPNWQLFYSFRKRDHLARWVVLVLTLEVLFSSDNIPFYCATNASSRDFCHADDLARLCTFDAFEKMFCDSIVLNGNKLIKRTDLQITDYLTTDPQAEILIRDIIKPKHIIGIYFQDSQDRKRQIREHGAAPLNLYNHDIIPGFFAPRSDYAVWQKEK